MYSATLLLAIHDCKVQILTGLPLGFLPEFVGFATVVLGFLYFDPLGRPGLRFSGTEGCGASLCS